MGAYFCSAWEYVRPAVRWQWTPGSESDTLAFRPRLTLAFHLRLGLPNGSFPSIRDIRFSGR
jgi:hypothetical protein